jgi:hypothetical protein
MKQQTVCHVYSGMHTIHNRAERAQLIVRPKCSPVSAIIAIARNHFYIVFIFLAWDHHDHPIL